VPPRRGPDIGASPWARTLISDPVTPIRPGVGTARRARRLHRSRVRARLPSLPARGDPRL